MSGRKRLSEVVNVLVNLVRNIQLRRQLSSACADPQLAFWRLIYGDLTDIAVLEWCKLFGLDDEDRQHLHWKSVSNPAEFRTDMLSRLGICESKWRSYWNEVKRYRDKSVAHHDLRRSEIMKYHSRLRLRVPIFATSLSLPNCANWGLNNSLTICESAAWSGNLDHSHKDFNTNGATVIKNLATFLICASGSFSRALAE